MSKQLYKLLALLTLTLSYSCGSAVLSGQDAAAQASCKYVDIDTLPEKIELTVPYVRQDVNYCGPASLSMVMSYYGVTVDQHDIGKGIVDDNGTSAVDLINRAGDYGFNAGMANCELNSVLSLLSESKPVIIRILNDLGDDGHFVVITGYDKTLGLIYLNDPDKPNRKSETFDHIKSLWNITTLAPEDNSENLLLLVRPVVKTTGFDQI